MTKRSNPARNLSSLHALMYLFASALMLGGCGGDGNSVVRVDNEQTILPAPTPQLVVGPYDDLPGVVITVVRLQGATGPGGNFVAGDALTVVFKVETEAGDLLDVSQMGGGGIMVSGPTFNYQRVFPVATNIVTTATSNGDGTWTYVFPGPLPSVYAAPYNDTTAFGSADGDLAGLPLLDGTYTVGIYLFKNYDVEDESYRDAGAEAFDFLFGNAPGIERREVISNGNCNTCHTSLRAHGGSRRDVRLCVLCHTSGSEDGNNAMVAGGTPGASIDFKLMIHRIHNGAHLPSVNGVTTAPDGTRDYSVAPSPYLIIGRNSSLHDFSNILFPVWPNLSFPMPRDEGFSALTPGQQGVENTIRSGVTACAKCHGDPDATGPLPAPSQGNIAFTQPSRNVCGSCHDDVIWERPYTANGMTMPASVENGSCTLCHGTSGSSLAVMDGHRHPMVDPAVNPGLNFNVLNLTEAGAANGNGAIDPGEKIAITFRVADDNGVAVDSSNHGAVSFVISGPTSNYNLLAIDSIAAAALSGPQPYTLNLPQVALYEFVGDSSAVTGEAFFTSRTPIWTMGATTTVRIRSGTMGGDTTTTAAAAVQQNYLDLVDPTGFARNDYIVVNDGAPGFEEYLRIQTITGTRIWFSSLQTRNYAPGVRRAHPAGTTVREIQVTDLVRDTDFSVSAATGTITELIEFGDGAAVLVDYVSDLIVPAIYPLPLNGSPDLDDSWGKWANKSVVSGTYTFGMWAARTITVDLFGETQNYNGTAPSGSFDFLVGNATTVEPYDRISSGTNCNACHNDIWFHGGGRRGFDTCILCHGTAGAEDRAVYVAANATNTPGVLVTFKQMLHKIHFGEELSQNYEVNGFGNGYPNNFSVHTYDEVVFPAMPGGAQQCAKCHGSSLAWTAPNSADHPTEQVSPARPWRTACLACHDSPAAGAHAEAQSPGGVESCAVCHGDLRVEDVVKVHFPR